MKYTLAAFTVREQALSAYELLQEKIKCNLVNTPRATGLGCGLSVQTSENDAELMREILAAGEINPDGYFSVSIINNKTIAARL